MKSFLVLWRLRLLASLRVPLAIVCVVLFSGCPEVIPDEPEEPEEVELVDLNCWGLPISMSSVRVNQIIMKYHDENVVFICSTDNGGFHPVSSDEHYFVKNVSLSSGEVIAWLFSDPVGSTTVYHAFIEVILKIDDNIVGYVVIEACRIHLVASKGNILKSVFFPKVGGKYQNISEEDIRTEIEIIKDEAIYGGNTIWE